MSDDIVYVEIRTGKLASVREHAGEPWLHTWEGFGPAAHWEPMGRLTAEELTSLRARVMAAR